MRKLRMRAGVPPLPHTPLRCVQGKWTFIIFLITSVVWNFSVLYLVYNLYYRHGTGNFLGFVSPCIIIHSNKSTNQMHQSLRFIAVSLIVVGPDRPRPITLLTPCSNGKPEAATAFYKLLMMGKRMPETCWAVFERRAINLRDWCIWLVDLFEFIKNISRPPTA